MPSPKFLQKHGSLEKMDTSTSRDLLQLENEDLSTANGAKLLSICKTKKERKALGDSFKTAPLGESSVLSRIKAFLPVLDDANRKLEHAIKEKGTNEEFDIEVLGGHEDMSYVEMDLALGVTELRSNNAVSAAEKLVGGEVIDVCKKGDDSDSSNESFDEDDEEDVDIFVANKGKRPRIEPLC